MTTMTNPRPPESDGESQDHGIGQCSLREWIARALDSIESSETGAPGVASDAFLVPALRVARSLAGAICQAEAGEIGTRRGSRDGRLRLPAADADWADRIVVHLSAPDDEIDDGKYTGLNLLPIPPAIDEDEGLPNELHNWMDEAFERYGSHGQECDEEKVDPNLLSLSPEDPTARPEELHDEFEPLFDKNILEEEEVAEENSHKVHYLSVDSASFLHLPPSNIGNGGECRHEGGAAQRICSLGLVLYELFSGGEKPPGGAAPKGATCTNGDGIELYPLGGKQQPLSYNDHNCTIDLASALRIADELDGGVGDRHDANQKNRKKKTVQCDGDMRFISVEPLKTKRLPWSLCNLISNMIDCARGDLSGDDCYRCMSDVCADLELMAEKPDVYLHDLDLAKMSLADLSFSKDAIYGRETEFSMLKDSYQRSIGKNDCECAIITGVSGSGKSCLANHLGTFATSNGTIFLSGKFDQITRAVPFSAFASALNQYCEMILKEGGTARAKVIARELKAALGKETHHLAKVIPQLFTILGEDGDGDDQDEDCTDARKRILYMICKFVEIITKDGNRPIILFLDDLQWSDSSSISCLQQLLMVSNTSNQFYFVGCCREISGEHSVSNMLTHVKQFGIRVTTIKLACMDEDTTNRVISCMLRLFPRTTRRVSNIIHHKTKGLPLFLSQMMNSMRKNGLLWLSLNSRRWEWHEVKIRNEPIPDNIAKYFASTIGKLPSEVQSSLSLLSCFGASTEISLIKTLESQLSLPLIEPLKIAVEEGLVDTINGRYAFSHDHVKDAAYHIIRPEERCLRHFRYGLALAVIALEDDDVLFVSASQMNLGGPASVENADEALIVAHTNLSAGKKAVGMSDFASAHSFFDNGISFLRKGHWHNHYDLSLQLFEAACQTALVIGEPVILRLLSEQVFAYAKTFEDRLTVTYVTIGALAYVNKLPELIEKTTSVLQSLGEELPEQVTGAGTKSQIGLTGAILNGFTDEELLNYKSMKDPNKLMAMKFYSRLETATQNARPDLQPIITLKMVQLSISYGWSPHSPLGLTYYGMMVARLGRIREGYRYVQVARKLLDKIGAKEVAGEVFFVGTQIKCFVEPIQSANESHLEGYTASMIAGDMSNAMTNVMFHVVGTFGSGEKLQKVKEYCANARRLMEQHNHKTWLIALAPLERSILKMIGSEDVPGENNPQETNLYPSMVTYLNNVYLHFMFRNYAEMKDNAEKYYACEKAKSWSLLYSHVAQELFGGLCSFWIYRMTNDRNWLERGQKSKSVMKDWAESSRWSFESRFFLLDAEEHFCCGHVGGAQSLYEKAILSAREHRFINDEALAHELAGYFFLEQGTKEVSLSHFGQAHMSYAQWGAHAKATALYESIQQIFGSIVSGSSSNLNSSSSTKPVTKSNSNVRKRSTPVYEKNQ